MSATTFLDRLTSLGVHLDVTGDRIHVDAPAGVLTSADREALREHKAELLAMLSTPQRPPCTCRSSTWLPAALGDPCPQCGSRWSCPACGGCRRECRREAVARGEAPAFCARAGYWVQATGKTGQAPDTERKPGDRRSERGEHG